MANEGMQNLEEIEKLNNRIVELEKQSSTLCDHLCNMCANADEDTPSQYRTEHFRSAMTDSYDYLYEIGYLKEENNEERK